MSLLDKFSTVEIKTDSRISEKDREFCLRQQELFDKSGVALTELHALMTSILERMGGESAYLDSKCNSSAVLSAMMKRDKTFIHNVVSYFSSTYTVELDEMEIIQHVLPEAPKDPTEPYFVRQNYTDEDLETYCDRLDAYKKQTEEYNDRLRHLPLRYEQVVDEIITQLGGFSFQERAMNELLAKCWEAGHREDWRTRKTVETFEVRNDTLKLLDTGSWCWCDDRYSWEPEWKPHDSLKVILGAIAHYQCGRMNEGHLWFPDLFQYDTKQNVFEIRNMETVKSIKLFKNGRVDIKFRSAAQAQEFTENYLRKYVEVDAA